MVLLGAFPVYKFTGIRSKTVLFVGIGLTGPFVLWILTSAIVAAGYLFETSTIRGGIVGFLKWLFGIL